MKPLTFLLSLLSHQISASFFNNFECLIDYRSMENDWELKLVHDIKQCAVFYKPPPSNDTHQLNISLWYSMRSFRFDSDNQEFFAYAWGIYDWRDERLKWDPKKYDGLKSSVVSSSNIWTPGIKIVNGISDEYDYRNVYADCEVLSKGYVSCISWVAFQAKCVTDLSEWPFDVQYCKLMLRLESKSKDNLQLHFSSRAYMDASEANIGGEWDIKIYKQERDTSLKQLTLTFRLERHANILTALVVYPSLILSALTLSSLFIDVRRNIRLLLLCFSLISHFYYLSELNMYIPKRTKDIPRLFLYYRASFVLTTIMTIFTFVLSAICRRKDVYPNYVISINNFMYSKVTTFVVWPRWKGRNEDNNVQYKCWIDFAYTLNTVCIVISIIAYVILYSVYIPHPATLDI